jgi:predicted glycogen debranching enzyme
MALQLGRDIAADWRNASTREWLVTNGLGSFAAGTVAGANTRRYHGLLIASLRPPVDRVAMLASLDVEVNYLGRDYQLQSHEFGEGLVQPGGHRLIESFALRDGMPTWAYAVADALIEKTIFMAHGRNTVYVMLRAVRAAGDVRVKLRPLCTYRDYHQHHRGAEGYRVGADRNAVWIQAFDGARPYRMAVDRGEFDPCADWYWNFRHSAETERGLDDREDLYVPGEFSAVIEPGATLTFVASAESDLPEPGHIVLAANRQQYAEHCNRVPQHSPDWVRHLAFAADQFIVQRGATATNHTVIAGYPWFSDWGRDTMIALPGLTTALGRFDTARSILRTFARHVDRGMLPNRFPDNGETAEYNTVDATLWFFEAVADYLQSSRDEAFSNEIYPTLVAILRAHIAGTRYGISVDPTDGLLRAGEPGVQLTWMDAKVGDWVVTPRIGKPVEINALWLNALNVTVGLANQLKDADGQMLCRGLLRQASAGFARFWNADRGYLHDVIDVDGGSGVDSSLRPNQLFAVSLPYSVLDNQQMRAVVQACGAQLLTSFGLRSLSPADAAYIGHYGGGQYERDGAYHQGTGWTWLLGPFALAHYRAFNDLPTAQSFLQPIAAELLAGCIGTISEITDGDAPHAARGCFAQAWSVAEALRAWIALDAAQLSRTAKTPAIGRRSK